MANKQIRYGIGFDVDKTGLQEVRRELQQFSTMSLKELKLINKEATIEDLNSIKASANQLSGAFEKSFNPKLGTLNVEKFNQELKNIGFNVKKAESDFAKMGSKGASAFRNLTAEVLTTQREVKQTNKFIDSMAKTLGNTIKWSIASTAINLFTSSIRQAWSYSVKLDKSLNDIRIVTEKSSDDMDKFAKKANNAAKALGSATTAYTKASLIYYQQGLSEEDVQARTDVTIKAANVTGQSAAQVSEQLTAVWNGYKVVAEEAEKYVDKLSAVAASTAADLEELSEGMSKVASGANAMGVDIDQLTAQLSTIVSVTRQDASSVGTALKTIFARMGDLKVDGVDEFGVSLGDVSGTLKQVGIEVLDQQGNLRDMGTVIEEVAGKWGSWTQAQQQAVAVAIAGKRQYNNLLALFENWDMYESALATSKGSEGTLQKQQDIYMDSIQAHLNQLSVAGEKVYDAFFDSDSMKDMIDAVTALTTGFSHFLDAIGGGGNLLLGLGSIATNVFSHKIAGGIMSAVHNFGLLKEYQRQYQAELEITAKYQGASDEAIQKMIALKEQELKYSKWLTDEQKQQFELYIKETNELANQKDSLEEKKKKLQEYYELMTGDERSLGIGEKGSNQYMVSDEQAAKNLEDKAAQIENTTIGQYNLLGNSSDRISGKTADLESRLVGMTSLNATTIDQTELENIQKELSNRAFELAVNLDDLNEKGALTAEQYNDLSSAINKAEKEGKGLTKVEKELKKIVKDKPEELRKQRDEILGLAKAEQDLTNKTKDSEAASKSFLKSVNTQALVSGVTKAIGVIGQLAATWSTIQRLGSIISDDSLTRTEKWTQGIMSALTIGTMAIATFKSMKAAITGIAQAIEWSTAVTRLNNELNAQSDKRKQRGILLSLLNKDATDEERESYKKMNTEQLKDIAFKKLSQKEGLKNIMIKTKEILVNWGVNASMAPLLAVTLLLVAAMAALALIVVGVVAIFNEMAKKSDDGKKAFEQASKAAQSATEEFNRLKEANEELKKSFEDYDKAQDAIENMTKGTEEWKQAIADANMQVIDLLDKYPELAQYVEDVDGQLKISEEGQKAMLEKSAEKVDIANRMRISANAGKLQAENNKIAQEGSTEYLKEVVTTSERAKGAAIGGLLGGSLGAAIGAAIGVDNEEERDAAYKNAIEVVNNKGNAILAESYEKFAEAMKEQGTTDEALIKALWEDKEALVKNANEVAANTKAIQLYREQTAENYFKDNEAYGKASDDIQKAVNKISSTVLDTESEEYKKIKQDYYGYGFFGQKGTKLDSKELETLGEDYANLLGVNYTKIKTDDETDLITFLDAQGNEVAKIIGDAAIDAIANEKLLGKFDVDKVIKALEEQGKNLSTGLKIATTTFVKNGEQTLAALKESEFTNNFTNINANTTNADVATAMGFKSQAEMKTYAETVGLTIDEYVTAVKKAVSDYQYELENIGKGMADIVRKAFIDEGGNIGKEYSLNAQKSLAKSLQYVFSKAGSEGVNALKEVVKNANLSEEDLGKVTSIVNSIDWKMDGALNEFKIELEKQGIIINENDEYWKSFIETMDKASNSIYTLTKGFDTIRNSLKEINDLTKDLKLGEIIDDDAYDKLINYEEKLKSHFVKTIDGWVYLGGADELLKKAKNNVLNTGDITGAYDKQNDLQNDLRYWYNQDENGQFTDRKDGLNMNYVSSTLASHEELQDFITTRTDYSVAQVQRANDVLYGNAKSSTAGFGAFSLKHIGKFENATALSLAQLGVAKGIDYDNLLYYSDVDKDSIYEQKEIEDLLLKNGISQSDIDNAKNNIGLAQTAMDEAGHAIDESNQVMTGLESAVNSFVNLDLKDEQIQTNSAILLGKYTSYKDFQAAIENGQISAEEGGNSQEVLNTVKKALLVQEAGELGIDSETWATITENTDFEGQNKVLQNEHKRNLYQEIDMYAEINREIEDINDGLDDWKESLEKMSAKELIDEYEKIDNKFAEQRAEALKLKAAQETEESFNRASLNNIQGAFLSKNYTAEIQYNADGTVANLAALQNLALNNSSDEKLVETVKRIQEYNDMVVKNEEDYLDTVAESYKDQLDMTIEAFNKKAEIRIDIENTIKDLAQFKRELDKTGWARFEDPDAFASYANALTDYGLDSASLQTAIDAVKTFDGGTGNRADFTITNTETGEITFNKTAYKEAYDAAIDRAKETYEAVMEDLQAMYDSYFTAQEELVDLYESQINKLTNINNLLSSQVEINKLLKKNTGESSVLMGTLYSNIAENRKKSYDLAVSELNALQKEYDKARKSGNDEMVRQTEENMVAAAEAVASASQEMFNALNEEFSALLSATVDDFLVAAAGADLSTITEDWQREIAKDERYLDDINASFGISELMRKFDKSIDENDSYTAQKKLLEQRTKQEERLNKILEERGKISQYELDRANAEYELTLKQIALEEAQRTASKMKLVRGADGNYSYQYVQDEDAVAEAQAELNAAQNELYNLDKDRNKDLVDDFYSTLSEMNEAVAAAGNDPERQKAIKEYYQGILGDIISELGVAGENFEIMGLTLGGDNWTSPLQNYTNAIREMNLEELFVDIDSLIGTFGGQTETIKNSLEVLVGDSSPLTTAIKSLDNSLLNTTDLAVEEIKLAELTNSILKELPNVQDYAKTLKEYIETYQEYLESYTGAETDIEDNTKALRDLTVAILNNTDMLDNKLDGQLYGKSIAYNNYKWDGYSWMYFDQSANE